MFAGGEDKVDSETLMRTELIVESLGRLLFERLRDLPSEVCCFGLLIRLTRYSGGANIDFGATDAVKSPRTFPPNKLSCENS
jgi:hypothetical protein